MNDYGRYMCAAQELLAKARRHNGTLSDLLTRDGDWTDEAETELEMLMKIADSLEAGMLVKVWKEGELIHITGYTITT